MAVMNANAVSMGLNAIADIMQVPLKYSKGTITGRREMTYNVEELGFKLNASPSPVAYCLSEQLAVLFHVAGDLYVLVAYFEATGGKTCYLIDKKKLTKDGGLSRSMTLKQAVDAMREGIVKSFLWKDRKWHPFALPAG